jgi:large repetitive protein
MDKSKTNKILIFSLMLVISLGMASACVCGNSLVEDGEQCDLGTSNGYLCWASYGTSCTYCSADCKLKTITNYCGDGIKQSCEECDDGNRVDDDLCSNLCKKNNPTPVCGDQECNGQETCSSCPGDCGICPPPTCDHNISVRYSYSNSYGTGIAVGYENGTWISEKPANLEKGNYKIKYFIDNNKEADDNVHIIVKVDNNVLSDYHDMINAYSSKELDLNTSQLCGAHTITLTIESDGNECDTSDNSASRQIYVNCNVEPPTPTCGDGQCNGQETCSSCPQDCGECECPACPPCNECIPSLCGNGVINSGEQCDDGNLKNFDGCSRLCYIESDYNNEDKDNECNHGDNNKDALFLSSCEANWKCTSWSECSNGIMTRQCHDENSCDSSYGQPIESTNCDSLLSNVYVQKNDGKTLWILGGVVLFIILVIIIVNLL